MKHQRGIDLAAPFPPAAYEEHGNNYKTLKDLSEWQVLGAKCGRCGHIAWLNHQAVTREIGNQYLIHLRGKLRCRCGNGEGNRVLLGNLPR